MKKLERKEMKNLMGGKSLVCSCTNAAGAAINHYEYTVCSYTTVSGAISCGALALQYCTQHGYGNMSCNTGTA